MFRNLCVLLLILNIFSLNIYAQLKKLSIPNLYSESEIYEDDFGNWYSSIVTVNFSSKTIDLPKGKKKAIINDIIIPDVKEIFLKIEKKYGKFLLEKEFTNSYWGDTISVNIVTKEKVILKDLSQFYKLKFDHIICVDSLIIELKMLPFIKSADRPFCVIPAYQPNDYSASAQWALPRMEATKAWDITRGSNDIKIGINDYFPTQNPNSLHNELRNGKVVYSYPLYLCENHGQSVSGCAAALTDNGTGIASIGFNTSLMFTLWTPAGIDSLRSNEADIINCSWITPGSYTSLNDAVFNALNTGIIVTAAAGNDTANVWGVLPRVTYPAAYNFPAIGKQVIAVTATKLVSGSEVFGDPDDGRWNYSPGTDPIGNPTQGFVDISAPGVGIKVLDYTLVDGYYDNGRGTSLAAPEVAGIIALIKSIYPALTPEIAYTILTNSTEKVGLDSYDANGWNQYLGYGRVNAYKALKYTLEHYGGTLTQNLTIPAGETWNFQPGITVTFQNGASLTVSGTLNANGGSSSTPITFDFISPNSTTENGMRFNSGSTGIVNYCQIRNAYRGIYENNVSINIITTAISGCTDGIYLYSSSPVIQGCNIHNNPSSGTGAGINLLNSSPSLYKNYIQNNFNGIYCSNNSNPVIGNRSMQTGNYISSNSYGVVIVNNAIPLIGNSSNGGFNNLLGNNTYNLLNTTGNTIYAQNNWWGSTNPANFLISGGPVSYTPYCTTLVDIPTPQLSKVNENIASSLNEDIPMLSELDKAYQLVDSKNYTEAREICLNLVNNYPDYSVSFNALNLLKDTYMENELSAKKNIYETLSSNKSRKDLYAIAGVLLSYIDKDNKIKHLDNVLNSYKEGPAAELAMFNKFVYYYFELEDINNAREVSKQLDERFPKSNASIEAHKILGDEEYFKMNADKYQLLNKEVAEVPTEFMLYDNYPNPFNPATVIKYAIPQNSKVVLEVYSTLGEKVATLVNEAKSAGFYETSFDGSNLSSGIYIYRLTANSLESGKVYVRSAKMLMIK